MGAIDPGTFVVVLNWQGYADSARLLRALGDAGVPAGQVVVVDNGSPDGSGARLEREFPASVHLQTGANLGFAGGMNRGIGRALERGAARVVLLNNDLTPGPGMLEAMEAAAGAEPEAAVVGAVIHEGSLTGPVAHAAHTLSPWTTRYGLSPVPAPGDPPQEADWVSGAALLLPAAGLAEVGLLDEDFFLYWEEVEYCFRARRRGFKVVVAPAARAVHLDRSRAPDAALPLFMGARNRWLFIRRALPWWCRPFAAAAALVDAARDVVGRTLAGKGGQWIPILGTWDGILGRTGTYRLEWVRARARL